MLPSVPRSEMTGAAIDVCAAESSLSGVSADLIAVPWFESEPMTALGEIDPATGGSLGRPIESQGWRGDPVQMLAYPIVDSSWQSRSVALVGAGIKSEFGTDMARKIATAIGRYARTRRLGRITFVLRPAQTPHVSLPDLAQAVAEGLVLSEFDVGVYKTSNQPVRPTSWGLIIQGGDGAALPLQAVERGRVLGECSNQARLLAVEPANVLTPAEFGRRAAQLTTAVGLDVEVLDESRINELGMGLLEAVARGSRHPPRLIIIKHSPRDAPEWPVLGLVGKGITFDTGGVSIKPADGMERMKIDMAGGAAVVAAMRGIAALRAPVRVVAVVPCAENMVGGAAFRPGDVLISASGKSVEVLNTDAEGRLVLADALWYARRLGATHLVDVATLTSSIVFALGKSATGLFGTPKPWSELVRRVANGCGEYVWPMPLIAEYGKCLNSDIADFTNGSGRFGGAIIAALFLKEFVEGAPWVHLDIAGTALADDSQPWMPKGPSGVAVRSLVELAFTSAEWPTTGAR